MNKTGELFEELTAIIAKLRDPQDGCPWDLEQDHKSLKPCLLEECYEVLEAIDLSPAELGEELGDLLLQIVLHAQIASESKHFDINTVVQGISKKLIERHPHVFGDMQVKDSTEVLQNWESIKSKNRKDKRKSILDGTPKSMPALNRAQRIGSKAARVDFDWQCVDDVKNKVKEEVGEFIEAYDTNPQDTSAIEEEYGDLLFALCQFARKMNINAEDTLQKATNKFSKRFKKMEELADNKLDELEFDKLEALWEKVKTL